VTTTKSRFRTVGAVSFARAALVLLAVSLAAGCGSLPPPVPTDPGRAAAEAYLRDYIEALNSNDPSRVAALTGKDVQDAALRLQRLGGRGLHDVALSLSSEFQRVYSVGIQATDAAGLQAAWRETIEWNGESWDFADFPAATVPAK
jgi:hypothetical protein